MLVNGEPTHSCLSLAIEAVNEPITTIEGLLDSPVQKAFVDNWAIQCGYCTPGFIVNARPYKITQMQGMRSLKNGYNPIFADAQGIRKYKKRRK